VWGSGYLPQAATTLVLLAGLTTSAGPIGPLLVPASAPAPNIAAFIPANYRVTSVMKMDLDGASVDEQAITAVGTQVSSGYVPTTVVLIAWDSYAKRWTIVFDAAREQSYQTSTQTGPQGPGIICTCGVGPSVAVMHDLPGHQASLVYWVPAVAGNTTTWLIGIVNFENQLANLAWSDDLDVAHIEAYGVKPRTFFPSPAVVGFSPHQELLVTAPWETPDDNQSYAVRQYSFKVQAVQQAFGEDYEVVDDTRSFVGLEVSTRSGPSGPAKVAYVYPGSPASGKIHDGDLVEAVAGAKAPPEAGYLNGPEVIDQIALFYPDQRIRLVVRRVGEVLDVPITLGSWSPSVEAYVGEGEDILVSM